MTKTRLQNLAHTIILSSGWTRRAIAFFSGAFGALAMPPFDVFPALVVPMSCAVWFVDGAAGGPSPRLAGRLQAAGEAAVSGWWLGFGFFVAGLWWLGAAFLVEADQFAWALPLGVVGLPAGLAFFPAVGFALARLLWSTGAGRVLALAVGLGFSEWLRSTVLTGFPWNNFGMALGGNLVLAQFGSVVGLHGLTVLAVAIAAAPATLADEAPQGRAMASYAAGALLLCLAAFGGLRLAAGEVGFEPNVRLRLMQPNLAQDAKFRPEAMQEIVTRYLALSDRSTSPQSTGIKDVTHLFWPESPFPVILSRDPESLRRIGAFLPAGTVLITGAVRQDAIPGPRRSRDVFYNSIQVVQSGGAIAASYDKVHLVPFGEYLPFRDFVDRIGLRQFVHIPGGFEAGSRRSIFKVPGLPDSAPLVCYEAIFPGAVVGSAGDGERPGVMINLTNDGWFGHTPGPYQHLAQARLRAVEEGLPLVRAANTGVSAIIDPYGRILGRLPLGRADVLDGALPKAIPPTTFARHPFLAPLVVWLLALLGALALRPRRRI